MAAPGDSQWSVTPATNEIDANYLDMAHLPSGAVAYNVGARLQGSGGAYVTSGSNDLHASAAIAPLDSGTYEVVCAFLDEHGNQGYWSVPKQVTI